MKLDLELKPIAIAQAARIYAYYEAQRPGLGERFIDALIDGYSTLRQNPFFQIRKAPYRYLKLRKFPYRLIYEVIEDRVIIYQVIQTKRRSHPQFGP